MDILVLSEMVFTGYTFKTKQEIEPFVEIAGAGPTFDWCKTKALK